MVKWLPQVRECEIQDMSSLLMWKALKGRLKKLQKTVERLLSKEKLDKSQTKSSLEIESPV